MTDSETNDFAAFEAQASKGDEPVVEEAKEEAVKEEEAPDAEKQEEAAAPETSEEQEDAPDAPDDEEEEVAEDEEEDGGRKRRRSKPLTARLAEERWKRGEAERELEELRSKLSAQKDEAPKPEKPNPDDFEYGESDPEYIDKLTDYKIEVRDAEKEAKKTEQQDEQRTQQQMFEKINTGVALAEEKAKAKYDDFDEKIAEAVKARDGEALPPLLTIGIGISPVGGDIIYRLATDEAASERLEKLAMGGAKTANQMAMALGELEGEYMDDDGDDDLDMTDQMDMSRMMGRMRARMKGPKVETPKIKTSNAPEPPKQRARGGSGQLGVSPDTTDFAAFEKLAAVR